MKQADIASFFTRKAGNRVTTPGAEAASTNSPILKDVNGPDKKRPREAVRGTSSSAAPSLGHGAAQVPAAGKLKRLRKASDATPNASVQEATRNDLEDEIEEASAGAQQEAGGPSRPDQAHAEQHSGAGAAEEAAGRTSPVIQAAASPVRPASQGADPIEDSEGPAPPQPIADAPKGKAKAKASAAKGPRQAAKKAGRATAAPAAEVTKPKEASEEVVSGAGSQESEEEEEEGISQQDPAARPLAPAILKAPNAKQKPGKAAKGEAKVEGVGSGAEAAALAYAGIDPSATASWKPGEPVPFALLAATFEQLAGTTKRLEKLRLLATAFWAVLATTPGDLLPFVYLCSNQVAPAHEGVELGVGDSILIKALANATGRAPAKVKAEYEVEGDLGTVAAKARATQKTMFASKPLTVQAVLKGFREIAGTQGAKSQDKKVALITKLLVSSKELEPGYIMRALQGKLRIGLGAETVLAALAHAQLLHRHGAGNASGDLAGRLERGVQAVKQAYSQCPSWEELVPALLDHPLEELPERVRFTPGVPVKPMLAKPTLGVSEVLDKFSGRQFTCEYKYDGERAQVHLTQGGQVSIYSRNSENMTVKYPDIAAVLPCVLKQGTQSVVLDCEAVAFERATGKILPFQVLSTRKRKDVEVEDIKVQVCLFAFDCLYLNGEPLLDAPLTRRREALRSAVTERAGELQFAIFKTSDDVEELGTFLNDSVAAGTEGLIVKTLDSTYEPSKRSLHWLKLKKDYLEGVGDTLDVVVIGAWFGKGKRSGVFGAFLLAVYTGDSEEFQTISKIGTGFSEEQLKAFSEQLRGLTIPAPKPYYRYSETLVPDVWFEPKSVWEVKCADFSISPRHKAALGLVDPEKGISIRFPRLVKVREDKVPEDATSAEQIAEMYYKQVSAKPKASAAAAADDE